MDRFYAISGLYVLIATVFLQLAWYLPFIGCSETFMNEWLKWLQKHIIQSLKDENLWGRQDIISWNSKNSIFFC